MRYHFIDKIKRIEYGKEIVVVKNVTATEDYFQEHFVGYPVFPGALQIEAMAQACGALTEISSGYQSFSILLMVEKMKFKRLIHPGDQLIVTARVISQHPESALFDVSITCDGQKMSNGTIMTGIVTASDRQSDYHKVIQTLEDYYRFLLRNAEIIKHP